MAANVIERVRNAARVRQIFTVAMRYGFAEVVQLADAAQSSLLRRLRRSDVTPDPQVARLATGERLRRMLEELGPTFIKLGQFLSTRPDLVPRWAAEALAKLQDRVKPMPFEEVTHQLETELGAPLGQLFASFEPQPLGAASLGQVHRAVLRTGEAVAVKVQRPGIEKAIARDLSVLNDIAEMLEGRLAFTRHVKLTKVAQELIESMTDELVYTIEGRNAERMAAVLVPADHVRIPKVFWNYTTPRILTTGLFEGVRFNEPDELEPEQRPVLARRLAHFVLKQILLEGFFNSDPHPGNLLAMDNGDLGIVDWGQVGLLTRRIRESLDEIFIAIATRDTERLTAEIVRLGLAEEHADLESFRYDLNRSLDRYFHLPRSDYPLSSVLRKILELSYEHGVQLPTEVPLLVKVLVATEGTCMRLDPEFELRSEFAPMARRIFGAQLDPKQMARNLLAGGRQLNRFVGALPRQLTTILDHLEAGNLTLKIDSDLDEPGRQLGRTLNRLSVAALVVGLMVGGAMVMEHSHALGLSTFLVGVISAATVLAAILRGERL